MTGDTAYAAGDALALITPTSATLVDAEVPAAAIATLWRQLDEGRGLAAVLEALTGAFGTSLAAIPAFAVALREGDNLRVAVRGSLEVVVRSAVGDETVSGAGVTTWSERLVTGATGATLRLAGVDGAADLPIRDGVVRASAVVLGGDDEDAAPSPASAPSAAAQPAVITTGVPSALSETLLPQDSTLSDAPSRTAPTETDAATAADASGPVDTPGEGVTTGHDLLFGATVMRPPAADEADLDEEFEPTAVVPPAEVLGDHDGATISVAEARALRAAAESSDAAPVDSAPPPLAPPRPGAIGRLRLSNGQVVTLDRTVVIGRRPRSTRVTGTDLPHLVAVDSPQQDISRSHLEVRAEGDSIVVTDLHTTNGTTLLRAGADPVRLHPGERTIVIPGDVVDLGDGITVTVEELA